MVNKSGTIGTKGETATVRAAVSFGFPHADRRRLAGVHDRGDILLCPGLIVEAKAGEAAKNATPYRIAQWLEETETEIDNNDGHREASIPTVGFLVVQRRGIGLSNALDWDAYFPRRMLGRLFMDDVADVRPATRHYLSSQVRISLLDALTMLRLAGYGDPL